MVDVMDVSVSRFATHGGRYGRQLAEERGDDDERLAALLREQRQGQAAQCHLARILTHEVRDTRASAHCGEWLSHFLLLLLLFFVSYFI